jgi:hypothetical protein
MHVHHCVAHGTIPHLPSPSFHLFIVWRQSDSKISSFNCLTDGKVVSKLLGTPVVSIPNGHSQRVLYDIFCAVRFPLKRHTQDVENEIGRLRCTTLTLMSPLHCARAIMNYVVSFDLGFMSCLGKSGE